MSNNTNTKSPDGNQKKGKMWRNANASDGPPQTKTMTPESAAKYFQQATSSRDVKISFGPSRPPTNNNNINNNRSVNFGTLDLQALKDAAAAASKPKSKGGKKNKDGLPCSEAEMKALMKMFVEIMGMSRDSDKEKHSRNSSKKKGPVFMFGNSNDIPIPPGGWSEASAETMAAATAGCFADGASWEAIRRTYGALNSDSDGHEDDDDDDSLPDLDDMREMFKAQQKSHLEAMKNSGDIFPSEWESLEQVAMDDALEVEERARKADKKREKRQRKKAKQKEEAAQKAAEAAQKKREKAVLSWRSRVVSACQSNEVSKLDALLQESPLRKAPDEETVARSLILPHLEFLLPNSVAKNFSQLERGQEARKRLAEYVLSSDVPIIVFKPLRSGRTALHTACFHGDIQFLRLALDRVESYEDTELLMPESYLNLTCDDSGWSPLHYAAVSGSKEVLETLLAAGCDTSTITDDTHTWRESDGKGITPRELIQYISREEHEKIIETHGVALQEMTNTFFSHHSERRSFLKNVEHVLKRLTDVETNGYSPPKLDTASSISEDEAEAMDAAQEQRETASSRKRKKKKKQAQKAADGAKLNVAKAAAAAQAPSIPEKKEEKDPLVVALLGMGFAEEQINVAVKACGGTNRATADDLVTWILGQDADGNIRGSESDQASTTSEPLRQEVVEVTSETVAISAIEPEEVKKAESDAKEQAEATQRLAAKREEQRRLNRAWNDREQSRQQEAAKTKIKRAMAPPLPTTLPPLDSYTAAYPSLQSSLPNEVNTGVAPGVNTAAKIGPSASKTMRPSQQKAPPVQSAAAPATHMKPTIQPKPSKSNPELQAPPKLATGSQIPSVPKAVYQSNAAAANPRSEAKRPPSSTGSYGLPPMGDDETTVSYFGSHRGLSVSSNSFAPSMVPTLSVNTSAPIPPPGFMTSTGAPPVNPPQMQPQMNLPLLDPSIANSGDPTGFSGEQLQLGVIRATAKAFVPSSYNPSMPDSGSMPSFSGAFANPKPSSQSQLGSTALEDNPMMGSCEMPSALPAGMGGPTGMTAGRMESSLPNSKDRMPSMMPINTDSITLTNSTLPMAGTEEPSLAGIPLGFVMDMRQHSGTSSLLSSISNKPPVAASLIWGGPQGVAPLGRLPSYALGENNGRDGESQNTSIAGWGAGTSTNLPTGGQGSIW